MFNNLKTIGFHFSIGATLQYLHQKQIVKNENENGKRQQSTLFITPTVSAVKALKKSIEFYNICIC